ncbi:MAG: hypothetical protein CL677_08170 [Bdellovibrionaceae bacterium]|nr:hypothetical protein [Pseudobdellovibrionaceae bacterium]|tara:strand:- start:66257 stop:68791 length:2535 start_codon:yes stop_codon:yes gene_type:complete
MKKRLLSILGILVFSFGVAGVFQNCSDVSFTSTDELFMQGISGDLRGFSFSPEQESPPEIQVHVVMDDSYSMDHIQAQVSEALSKTADELRGFDGQVSIIPTSQDTDFYISNTYFEYSPDGGAPIRFSLEEKADIIPEDFIGTYKEVTEYDYQLSAPMINFSSTMDSNQFAQFTEQFSQSINAVGTEGSDQEQGLCAVIRTAEKSRQDGKFHAYIVVTNENDATNPEDCLKSKTVDIVGSADPSSSSETCAPGEDGCINQYQVTYEKSKNEKLNYTYNQMENRIEYESSDSSTTYKVRLKYLRSRLRAQYKQNTYKYVTRYNRTNYIDNIPVQGSSNTVNGSSSYGECSSTTARACTADEYAQYGAFEGTCSVTCENGKTGNKNSYKGFVYGDITLSELLALESVADSSASGCKSFVESEFNKSSVTDCTFLKNTSNVNGSTITVNAYSEVACSNAPSDCTDNSTIVSEAKTDSGTNWLLSVNGSKSYSNIPDGVLKCEKRSCSESSASGTIQLGSQSDYCSGLGKGDTGDVELSCTDSDEDQVRVALGLEEGDSVNCKKYCNQSLNGSNKTITSATQACNIISNAECDDEQWDIAVTNAPASARLASCGYSCAENSAPQSCSFYSDQANLCNLDDGTNFQGNCTDRAPLNPYKSCNIASSARSLASFDYIETRQSANVNSHLEDVDPVVKASSTLSGAHGSLFYVSSFIYPTNPTTGCGPQHGYNLTSGERYESLSEQLGVNAGTYPVCMDDYSPAFQSIFSLITIKARTSYRLAMDKSIGEWVYRIHLIYKDGRREELAKHLYSEQGGTLSFSDQVDLDSVAKVDVEVVVPDEDDDSEITEI